MLSSNFRLIIFLKLSHAWSIWEPLHRISIFFSISRSRRFLLCYCRSYLKFISTWWYAQFRRNNIFLGIHLTNRLLWHIVLEYCGKLFIETLSSGLHYSISLDIDRRSLESLSISQLVNKINCQLRSASSVSRFLRTARIILIIIILDVRLATFKTTLKLFI